MNEQRGKKDPSRGLAEINRAITNSLSFDEVLDLIVENATQLVGARATALLLVGRDGMLRIRAARGLDSSLISSFIGRLEEEVIRQLKKSLSVNEGETLLSLPIIAKNELNGLLIITREKPLTADEQWQLSALADQAAIALRNARLFEIELGEATRKRDETLEALKESNNRITTILESITDLYYSLDREWRFTEVNRQTETRFQKSRRELIGNVIWEVYPAAVDSPLYSEFHKAMNEMVAVHFELESKIVPGVWFEAHAYPSTEGLSVYLRDISERKLAEATSKFIASIVESSDDAIVSKDLNGVINSWNKGAERLFGYTAEEALGRNITMLIPEDRFDEEPAIMERIRSGRRVHHYETVRCRKDGTLIDISLSISPMFDDKGRVFGASKIARDISERKRRDREIRFQADLLNAVEQAVIATDLTGRIIYWNTFAERLYGWTCDQAIGANVIDLIPAENAKEQAIEIFAKIRDGASWSGELTTRKKNGETFTAMVTDSPILSDDGQLFGVVGISSDITDQKRAEEEHAKLLQSERAARNEAEEANRLKDEFLATLSHELRNPLNVILGYSEVLLGSREAKESQFIKRAAEVVRRNALAQAQLIRDLLDLSRLHIGLLSINREAVSLTTTVTNAVETVRGEAADKNITLEVSSTDKVLFVNGDPLRLEQIVWNLLNNAVKFTPAGGKVMVKLETENDSAVLQIKDTGEGIDPSFLPHVFEMFRQADASSSRKHGGMGIGLALVQRLARLHDGSVWANSEGVGRGATFEVRLPLSYEARDTHKPVTQMEPAVLSQLRILVVDDSPDTVDMLKSLFEMDGALVSTANSGAEALEIINQNRFDVILSDISMPGMDGFELLRRLRKLPGAADVPVLALTGFGRAEDVDRAEAEGFFSHVTKPIDLSELVEILQKLPART
jgi:PAS domain S-box-containing protein